MYNAARQDRLEWLTSRIYPVLIMARPLLASMLMLSLVHFSCEVSSPLSEATVVDDIPAASGTPAPPDAAAVALLPVEEAELPSVPQVAMIAAYLHSREMGLSWDEKDTLARTIDKAARAHHLEPGLVLAVIHVESGFDPFAVSSAGAFGLMQIRPPTGEELAKRLGIEWRGTRSLFDPITNVKLGVAYLEELRERFGDIPTALAAYNWGPGHIGKRLRGGRAVPAGYSKRVLDNYSEFAHSSS